MRKVICTFIVGILVAVSSTVVLAQDVIETDAQVFERPKYGVGFQGTFPANGLSGMYDINENFSAQAILGFFSNLKTFAGRGLYRFNQDEFWNAYGYGMVGVWSYSWLSRTETVPGFGAGGGIEYDWRALDEDLPALYWNIELGIGAVNFNDVNYNFSTLLFGVGVHYRF